MAEPTQQSADFQLTFAAILTIIQSLCDDNDTQSKNIQAIRNDTKHLQDNINSASEDNTKQNKKLGSATLKTYSCCMVHHYAR